MPSHDLSQPDDLSAAPESLPLPPPSSDDHSGEIPEFIVRLDSGSGSADGLSASGLGLGTTKIAHDPILGVLADATASAASNDPPDLLPEQPFSVPVEPMMMEAMASNEFGALGGLDLTSPAAASTGPRPAGKGDEIEEEIVYVSGPSWPMILLASYASAVTLALIWWVVIPKFRGRGDLDGFVPGAAAPAVGTRRDDSSRTVEAARPIPPDRMTVLGRPLKVGSLEITPIKIDRTDVKLRRTSLSGETEQREGGEGATSLLIRLRNTSNDAVFSPLDEAFIRDKDDGVSDSFVELSSGERVYLYPLPVESEWSIVGQQFPVLKPGESKETVIVTAADFPPVDSGMTWRLRLRTGLESTEVVGVSIPSNK